MLFRQTEVAAVTKARILPDSPGLATPVSTFVLDRFKLTQTIWQ